MPTKKKKQSLLTKLNLSSPKNRIILTVALFAVVGGGITVYKSFAASIIGTANADQIVGYSGGSKYPTKIIKDDVGGKANVNVWQVPIASSAKPKTAIRIPANTKYQVCYNVKGVGEFSAFGHEIIASSISYYKYYCTRSFSDTKAFSFQPSFMNISPKSNTLYLQNITIQTAGSPVAPTPAYNK